MRERCCSRPARDRVARQPGGRRPRRAHRRESGACGGEREPRQPPACVRLLGLALAAAVVAVGSLLGRSDGETLAVQAANGVPALTSKAQLQRLAASVDHPVYWAGPRPGFSYELTRTTTGRIFVRYLPHGVATGDSRPDFLIVGTYPGDRPFADLKRAANREGVDWVGLD